MDLLKTIKNSVLLLAKGEWREFYIRSLIVLGLLDIKTTTSDELDLPSTRCHSYSDSGRADLQKILSLLTIKMGDRVVDFGCGKGGALIAFADYPFSKITGVEISGKLVDIARKNLARLRMDNIEIICCDATDFQDLDDYNYVYFFNPFPCSVMDEVVRNIRQSLARNPRKITVIYLNPECHQVLARDGIFHIEKETRTADHAVYIYSN